MLACVDCSLDDRAVQAFVLSLPAMMHLVQLDISRNPGIQDTASVCKIVQHCTQRAVKLISSNSTVAKWMASEPHDKVLAVQGSMDMLDCAVVGSQLHELETLDMSKCKVGNREVKQLADAFAAAGSRDLEKLRVLDISGLRRRTESIINRLFARVSAHSFVCACHICWCANVAANERGTNTEWPRSAPFLSPPLLHTSVYVYVYVQNVCVYTYAGDTL